MKNPVESDWTNVTKIITMPASFIFREAKVATKKARVQKQFLSWGEVDELLNVLVKKLKGRKFDLYLGISRGGLVPTGILAKRLKHFDVTTISIMYYDEKDRPLKRPIVLEVPAEYVLRGKRVLIIDDVWDRGKTIKLVKKMVLRAGGIPFVATIHFKPTRSKVRGKPNFYAKTTKRWIVYPWEDNNSQP